VKLNTEVFFDALQMPSKHPRREDFTIQLFGKKSVFLAESALFY